MAKDKTNDIRFEDECHFQQHGSRCRMWFPPEEKDPVLLHAPTRKTMSLFGVVVSGVSNWASTLHYPSTVELF